MREVARRAGVSAKTVSRVYNDDASVAPDTRERVERALRELAYAPNLLAKTFRAGRDDAVAVAVPDASDPFFAAVVAGVTSVAAREGSLVVVTSFGDSATGERSALEMLLSRQVAGIITAPVSADQSYLRRLAPRTPLVFVDREPRGLDVDHFVEDDAAGARAAVRHLVDHGHRRIAFVGDDLSVPTSRSRWEGFHGELSAAGIEVDQRAVLLGSWPGPQATASLHRLAGLQPRPTAVFSSNARATMWLVEGLRAAGLGDLALVSYGDFPLAAALQPPLTVIEQDSQRLGALAAERLFARLRHPDGEYRARNVLPVRLVARGSGEVRPSPVALPA